MKANIACGLDIGNHKLAAVIGKSGKRSVEILVAETAPTQGFGKGVVQDLSSLTESIQKLLVKVSHTASRKIRRLLVSINGDYITGRHSCAAVALSDEVNRHITLTDVNYLQRQARLLGLQIQDRLLHEFLQDYVLDDHHATTNPVGLLARKIQLNSYLLSASHTLLGNITTAVQQAGYDVERMLFSGVASSLSVLSEEERKKGVALIDMGASCTTILFFQGGILRDFYMIPYAGNEITNDIAHTLNMSWELAEEVKKSSLVLSAERPSSDTVVVKRTGSYRTIERSKIYEAARTRLTSLLDSIVSLAGASPWRNKMTKGIVCIGGSASIEGVLETIEHRLALPVRLGYINSRTMVSNHLGLPYSAAAGLLYYYFHCNTPPRLNNFYTGKTYVERTVNFVRNLYHEYF